MLSHLTDLSDLNMPIRLERCVRLNSSNSGELALVKPEIVDRALDEAMDEISGGVSRTTALATRLFDFEVRPDDQVLVNTGPSRVPMLVRRDNEIIVNFDIRETQAVGVPDSKRPIYTYIPGFNIHSIPESIRRPLSNCVQSMRSSKGRDFKSESRGLPLTGFDYTVLLLSLALGGGRPYRWPNGKRAVFIALHDVDSAGFLTRRERDPLFLLEAKHGIRSTWFIPTAILGAHPDATGFLEESGHEIGWHGHKHDHRDHVGPYAEIAVQALNESPLMKQPVTGMRLPKLLKSNHLYNLLDQSCPGLCYDTSLLRGITPYQIWLKGRPSRILEIPTTVPTDIVAYNRLPRMPRLERTAAILATQISRTEKLIESGGIISIVTHPEKELSERPDLLDVYDGYLSFITKRTDVWFTTAGELYRYWTSVNANVTPSVGRLSSV